MIENMSYLEIDGKRHHIFGNGGGEAVASRLSEISGGPVKLLGQIPISENLREASDQGRPIVAEDPEDPAARAIWEIATEIAAIPRGLIGKKLGINPV